MGDALLILLGAAVGALGSIGGSVVVNRRELLRRARIRMYHELVPALIDVVNSNADQSNWDQALIEALYRESALASKRDQTLVEAALDGWQRQAAITMEHNKTDPNGDPDFPIEHLARWTDENHKYLTALTTLEEYLRTKIR